MSLIDYLNNSDWLLLTNRIIPMLATIALFTMFFSRKWGTSGKLISTILVLKLITWLMLIWADWGSTVFQPSFQTVIARVLILITLILILTYILMMTEKLVSYRTDNFRLKCNEARYRDEIAMLKAIVLEHMKHKLPEGENYES